MLRTKVFQLCIDSLNVRPQVQLLAIFVDLDFGSGQNAIDDNDAIWLLHRNFFRQFHNAQQDSFFGALTAAQIIGPNENPPNFGVERSGNFTVLDSPAQVGNLR